MISFTPPIFLIWILLLVHVYFLLFLLEKPKVKVLSKTEIIGALSPAERARIKDLMEQNQGLLTVLKRHFVSIF